MTLEESWIESANHPDCPFPLNNLPLGVFSLGDDDPRCGVAIGDFVLDARAAEGAGLINLPGGPYLDVPFWNEVMEAGPAIWSDLRRQLTVLFAAKAADRSQIEPLLFQLAETIPHMPLVVVEYTDFYSGRNHAFNVGSMFRGPENALPPNWLHMPIGYNGRASSVVVSGTPIRRPWGQLKSPERPAPAFLPSRRFDFELEMGAIVGTASDGPQTVDQADAMIFGYVLLNDWSARDIQAFEYQPLGPFQAKATATSISPWIVMKEALLPFRVMTPSREVPLLAHLQDTRPMLYDIELAIALAPQGTAATRITATNYREMYYSAAQQIAHHTSSGCPMSSGDLIGSGTISGTTRDSRGSLLELSWGGKEPITLDTGDERSFLLDGDTVSLHGIARGEGYTIGFGNCSGEILPALENPYRT